MTFDQLIKSHAWLSVKSTMITMILTMLMSRVITQTLKITPMNIQIRWQLSSHHGMSGWECLLIPIH